MKNQKGSAIAVVLLVLGVLSLLGAGMLLQSRLDTRITKGLNYHDEILSFADDASVLARTELVTVRAPKEVLTSKATQGVTPSWVKSDLTVSDQQQAGKNVGYFTSKLSYRSFDAAAPPGYEEGMYYVEFWVAEGTGKRRLTDDASTKEREDAMQTTVQMALGKIVKKN